MNSKSKVFRYFGIGITPSQFYEMNKEILLNSEHLFEILEVKDKNISFSEKKEIKHKWKKYIKNRKET